jgi:hypothetical protein
VSTAAGGKGLLMGQSDDSHATKVVHHDMISRIDSSRLLDRNGRARETCSDRADRNSNLLTEWVQAVARCVAAGRHCLSACKRGEGIGVSWVVENWCVGDAANGRCALPWLLWRSTIGCRKRRHADGCH